MKANGTLGQFMLRPICDIDGHYKATKCIPGQMYVRLKFLKQYKYYMLMFMVHFFCILGVIASIKMANEFLVNRYWGPVARHQ